MPTLHGVNLSPFVRKTRVYCIEKGIHVDLVPVMPGSPDPEYRSKSPLGKIPCLEDADFVLPDSSCICAYLERIHPEPALYPADPAQYGRALWYEEYADTKLLEATIVPFVERVINAKFLRKQADEARVQRALENVAPGVFDYLESQLEDRDYLVGNRFSIADIATATSFVNMGFGGERVDAARWPRLAAYVERIHARPSFKSLIEEEEAGLPA